MTPHCIDLSVENSPDSAQPKTWHVAETKSNYAETRELKSYSKAKFETSPNTDVKDKQTFSS